MGGNSEGGELMRRNNGLLGQFVGPLLGGLIGVGGTLAGAFANNYFQAEREQKALFRDERRQVYAEVERASWSLLQYGGGKSEEAEIERSKDRSRLIELWAEVTLVGGEEVRHAMLNVYERCGMTKNDPKWHATCPTATSEFTAAARKEMGIE